MSRRGVRARKPVSYIEVDPNDSDVLETTDHVDETNSNASENDDPDFQLGADSSSEGELGKENCPPKKRKSGNLKDFMTPLNDKTIKKSKQKLSQQNIEQSEVSGSSQAPSAQLSRLDELQKVISERGRNSLSKQCDKSEETFTGIMSGIKSVRANGTPLRSASTAASITKKG